MRESIIRCAGLLSLAGGVASIRSAQQGAPEVTYQDLLNGLKDPTRWLTYSGDYSGQRHSPLKQITPENARRLVGAVDIPDRDDGERARLRGDAAGAGRRLVRDRSEQLRVGARRPHRADVLAVSPRAADQPHLRRVGAGEPRVRRARRQAVHDHARRAPPRARHEDRQRRLGRRCSATTRSGYSATMAPLVVKDKVIVGISGGDYPTRGFLDAYDPQTGTRVWRFYTVPGPGEPGSETWPASTEVLARGGGATWVTGSYDPELNTLYWGTGNPNPDYYGDDRKGDNLYTGLAHRGRRRHRQAEVALPVHAARHCTTGTRTTCRCWPTCTIGGQPRKVVMVANRNGFFYVLDRVTGKVIFGKPFTDTTWARELGPDGHPDRPQRRQQGVSARSVGRHELHAAIVRSGAAAVLRDRARNVRDLHSGKTGDCARPRIDDGHGPARSRPRPTARCARSTRRRASGGGSSSTSRRPLPACCRRRRVWCSAATTKATSWRSTRAPGRTCGTTRPDRRSGAASPMTYMLDGRQYVIIGAGTTITTFALPVN